MDLNDDAITRVQRFVDESIRILRQCKSDIVYMRRHGSVIYHLDFSLLAPVFFNKTPIGAKRLFSIDKAKYISLLGGAPVSPVTISITGPTLFEFLDFLNHDLKRVDELKNLASNTAGSLKDQLKLLTSEEVIEYVKRASTHDLQPAKKLESMLEQRRLVGLGDVIHEEILPSDELSHELKALVELQFKLRQDDEDKKSRSNEDRNFHYLMDSMNALITKALLGKDRVFFVTNNKAIRSYCASSGHTLVRDPWVPVFVKNLIASHNDLAVEYIDDALRIYEAASNAIKTGGVNLPSFRAYSSGCTQYHQLFSGGVADPAGADQDDEATKQPIDKKSLEDALEKTVAELKQNANGLLHLSQKYNVGYFDLLEISDDPIYRQINKNLLGG